jgi:hypothetical protein
MALFWHELSQEKRLIDRRVLVAILKRYEETQPEGVKQVDAQIALFSDQCVFVSFPVATVVGSAEARLLHGRQAICDAFQAYNDFIAQQEVVTISYLDAYADARADGLGGVCGFTLLIEVQNGEQRSMATNQAQFHVDAQGLVYRMMNWQASSTAQIRHVLLG